MSPLPQFLRPEHPRRRALDVIPADWVPVLDVMGSDLEPEDWARRIGIHVCAIEAFLAPAAHTSPWRHHAY